MPADPTHELVIAEPAGAYERRSPLVVDCSVLAAMVFDEPRYADAVEAMAGKELFAPYLIDDEMANVAATKSRQGKDTTARHGLAHFSDCPITRCRVDVNAQFRTVLEHGISAYDAAYLQLSLDLKAPLATFDARLGTAARKALSG